MYHTPMSVMQTIGFIIAGAGTYQYSRFKESNLLDASIVLPGQRLLLFEDALDEKREAADHHGMAVEQYDNVDATEC